MGEVASVRSCLLPLDLYYRVEEHLWVRREEDGTATLGMTDMAQTTAGRILVVTFKPVGRFYGRGKAVSVVESGKWSGPVRTPVPRILGGPNYRWVGVARWEDLVGTVEAEVSLV
jgi:glycine cleavage system H protein